MLCCCTLTCELDNISSDSLLHHISCLHYVHWAVVIFSSTMSLVHLVLLLWPLCWLCNKKIVLNHVEHDLHQHAWSYTIALYIALNLIWLFFIHVYIYTHLHTCYNHLAAVLNCWADASTSCMYMLNHCCIIPCYHADFYVVPLFSHALVFMNHFHTFAPCHLNTSKCLTIHSWTAPFLTLSRPIWTCWLDELHLWTSPMFHAVSYNYCCPCSSDHV